MRVLILTNHFSSFAGSEIVALEVAQWFVAQKDDVLLAANYINPPIDAHAQNIPLTLDIEDLQLTDFDLIWCQHDLLTLLPMAAYERAARGTLPHVALVSLSPYELYEHIDASLAGALSADVLVNSPETAEEILRRGEGAFPANRLRVFHNAAPRDFWSNAPPRAAEPLRSVTLISNHPPPELVEAMAQLEREGIRTLRFGMHYDWRLIQPDDIAATDAIVTIGKSAPYAIAQRKPVYLYDCFGGDGWLTRANVQTNLAYNFSGRPVQRRLSAAAIAQELKDGFAQASQEMSHLHEAIDLRPLQLEHHLAALRQRAAARAGKWRALKLRRYLASRDFRVHLGTLRAKSNIMKRSFIQTQPVS